LLLNRPFSTSCVVELLINAHRSLFTAVSVSSEEDSSDEEEEVSVTLEPK